MPSATQKSLSICLLVNRAPGEGFPLADALKKSGHDVRIINLATQHCEIKDGYIVVDGEVLAAKKFDGVLKRLGCSEKNGTFETANEIARVFELQGIPTYSTTAASRNAADKIRSRHILNANGINTPIAIDAVTGATFPAEEISGALGPPPYVLKTQYGACGSGVSLSHSAEATHGRIQRHFIEGPDNRKPGFGLLVQEYIPSRTAEGNAYHIRVLVINGKAVAASQLQANSKDEFRSNRSLGATPSPYQMNKRISDLAERATQCIGLRTAGVDIVIGNGRAPAVLEVNDSPDLGAFDSTVKGQFIEDVIAAFSGNQTIRR